MEIVGPGSPARVSRPFTGVADHILWLEVEEGRENRARAHSTSTSVGRSSAEDIAKLNSLNFIELQWEVIYTTLPI